MTDFDVAALRRRFPALSIEQDGRPVALFDGPGGTQVPDSVIDAVARYYRESNANADGAFLTSQRSDAIVAEAHQAMADMLGAADASEIKFGANMTTLTFHISRSIAATMAPGDEIVVTGLDHHGNVDPWLGAAADRGLTVRGLGAAARRLHARPRGSRRVCSARGRSSSRWAGRRTPSARSTRSRRSSAAPTRPAPGRTSTRFTRRRTCRSTSRRSTRTSSPARRTSSSVRMPASSTARARSWTRCRATS